MVQASRHKTEEEKGRRGKGATKLFSPLLLFSSSPFLLFCLALALRLWGITWGLPDQNHLFSYHPDEGVNLVNGVLESGVPRPHLDLGFYNYGALYFYLWQGAVALNRTYALLSLPSTGAPNVSSPESVAAMILVGRLLTAILGAGAAWAVFALGNRLFGKATGLVAATTYAVMPAAVVHGHYATVDVPATFFVTVALVFGARLLAASRRRDGVLAGLFCGLAAATKYNCGLVLFAPLAALLLRRRFSIPRSDVSSQWGGPWPGNTGMGVGYWEPLIVLASAAAGFVIGCPGVVLNWPRFSADFSYELKKSGEGMGLLFAETGSGWVYHLTSSLYFGLGPVLLGFTLAALGFALVRHTRQDWYLLAFLIPYYLLIGYAQVRFLRYVIPLFPVLAVFVGRFVSEPWPGKPVVGRVLAVLGGVVGLVTLLYSLSLDQLMAQPDARDRALAYIRQNVPRGKTIAFATTPWYYTPPLVPEFTAPSPAVRRRAAEAFTDYVLRLPEPGTEWDKKVFEPMPDYVLLSNIESADAIRVNWAPARPFLEVLKAHYVPRVFENERLLWGIRWENPQYAPNDWLYIMPRIALYTRK